MEVSAQKYIFASFTPNTSFIEIILFFIDRKTPESFWLKMKSNNTTVWWVFEPDFCNPWSTMANNAGVPRCFV